MVYGNVLASYWQFRVDIINDFLSFQHYMHYHGHLGEFFSKIGDLCVQS